MIIEPVTLIGQIVRLEPLSEDHIPQLAIAGKDERIWRYLLYGDLSTSARMQTWVKAILDHQARGTDPPFAVIHLKNDCAIGATRYLDIRPEHRRVEIGGTWYCTDYQQTAVNTECKYMMLRHGFETWECTRIQFNSRQTPVIFDHSEHLNVSTRNVKGYCATFLSPHRDTSETPSTTALSIQNGQQ